MSFVRNVQDHKHGKINNLVARDDEHRGGFHGKTMKAQRTNFKQGLNQYALQDLLYDEVDIPEDLK